MQSSASKSAKPSDKHGDAWGKAFSFIQKIMPGPDWYIGDAGNEKTNIPPGKHWHCGIPIHRPGFTEFS